MLIWLLCWLPFMAAPIRRMQTKRRFIDNPHITLERALELDPEMPRHSLHIIATFDPWSISRGQWEHVRHFAAETAVRMRPHTPDAARRVINIAAGFIAWAWALTDCELDVRVMFTANLVARYLASNERMVAASAGRRWDVSRQLAKIGELLGGDRHIATTPAPIPGHGGRVLTEREIASMYSWAVSMSTAHKRRNACAIIALAAGAGLTAAELAQARVEHIRRDRELTFVDVPGRRARTVPVLSNWRKTLDRAIDGRTQGLMFAGYRLEEYPPRAIQSFLTANPAPIRPSIRDLRRGWIVTQVDAGVPLLVVSHVSGFNSLGALEAYLGYTKQPADPTAFYTQIANAGGSR